MLNDKALNSMVRAIKRGNGQRWFFMVAGVLLVAAIIAMVVVGFRDGREQRGAGAGSATVAEPTPTVR